MIHCGDALTVLRALPAASVQCCITSPPYWGLRDYGVDGQIGLEETPDLYVWHLLQIFREVRRVLRDDGTLWLNLGDSYTSGGHKERNPGRSKLHRAFNGEAFADGLRPDTPPGLKPKDLVGIPWRVAFALQADGWWLRSDIVWAKPAPMPESVTDRPTRSHEYIFLLSKSPRYFYDHEAIKEPSVSGHGSGNGYKRDARLSYQGEGWARGSDEPWRAREVYANQASKHLTSDPQSGQRRLAESVTAARKATGEAPTKKELRMAIEIAMTEAIAASAVAEWLAESAQCPTPAEIRRLINAKQERLIEDRRHCEACGGVGWITVFRGGLSGARECECRKALVRS